MRLERRPWRVCFIYLKITCLSPFFGRDLSPRTGSHIQYHDRHEVPHGKSQSFVPPAEALHNTAPNLSFRLGVFD